jgi:hypothetical protein
MTETIGVRPTAFEDTLRAVARKAGGARKLRHGDIAFRLAGTRDVVLTADRDGVRVAPAGERTGTPLIEVFGDPDAVEAVLSGKVEGRKQFLKGGIRVRGDLRYLSDLALELGLLEKPL